MDNQSWLVLEPDPMELRLPDDLRARDPLQGRDCGWVSQMRPFVQQFCRPGRWVFDPFCGFGTTLLAAHLENRLAIGMEVDPDRAHIARERLQRHGCHSAVLDGSIVHTKLPETMDLCLSNVPYFGCQWPGQAAQSTQAAALAQQMYAYQHYRQYLNALRDVFYAVRAQLAEGGHCIVMVENIVLNGRAIPQAHDIAQVLAGLFEPCEERLLCYQRSASPISFGSSASNRSHETALIFQKRRQKLDLTAAATLLQALDAAGFRYELHGSYATWLQSGRVTDATPTPADIDIWVPHDQRELDRLLHWLHEHGFDLTLWGQPIAPTISLQYLHDYHYLRAKRLNATGQCLQLDVSLQPSATASSSHSGR